MYLSLMFSLWKMPEMREKVICCVQNIFIPPTMLFWLLASELNMKCKMKSVVVMIGGWGALSPIPAISIYFHSPQLTEILDYYRYVPKMRVKFTSVQKGQIFCLAHYYSLTWLRRVWRSNSVKNIFSRNFRLRIITCWQLFRIISNPGLLWNSREWLFVSN